VEGKRGGILKRDIQTEERRLRGGRLVWGGWFWQTVGKATMIWKRQKEELRGDEKRKKTKRRARGESDLLVERQIKKSERSGIRRQILLWGHRETKKKSSKRGEPDVKKEKTCLSLNKRKNNQVFRKKDPIREEVRDQKKGGRENVFKLLKGKFRGTETRRTRTQRHTWLGGKGVAYARRLGERGGCGPHLGGEGKKSAAMQYERKKQKQIKKKKQPKKEQKKNKNIT